MVYIIEIEKKHDEHKYSRPETPENLRTLAGRNAATPQTPMITNALQCSICIQFTAGLLLSLFGLSGLPADLFIAGKIFGLGFGQCFCASPGFLGMKYKRNRIWIGFAALQFIIALCQLTWFIVVLCLDDSEPWLATLYFCLFVFQVWCAIAAMLHAKITSFQIFVNELRGNKHSESLSDQLDDDDLIFRSPAAPKQSSTSLKQNFGSVTSSKEKYSKVKPAKKSSTKSVSSNNGGEAAKSKKAASSAAAAPKSEEKQKAEKVSKEKQDKAAASAASKNDTNAMGDKVKPARKLSTPTIIRHPRYYFIEHATDIETEISGESPEKEKIQVKKATVVAATAVKAPSKAAKKALHTITEDLATPPADQTQPNSLLSSQATQNSHSGKDKVVKEAAVAASPAPPAASKEDAKPVATVKDDAKPLAPATPATSSTAAESATQCGTLSTHQGTTTSAVSKDAPNA